jgi:hypothetical protein
MIGGGRRRARRSMARGKGFWKGRGTLKVFSCKNFEVGVVIGFCKLKQEFFLWLGFLAGLHRGDSFESDPA